MDCVDYLRWPRCSTTVHRGSAIRHAEGRDLGSVPAASAGGRLLPDRVGAWAMQHRAFPTNHVEPGATVLTDGMEAINTANG